MRSPGTLLQARLGSGNLARQLFVLPLLLMGQAWPLEAEGLNLESSTLSHGVALSESRRRIQIQRVR